MDIAAIRKEYSKESLDITNVDRDPVKQFDKWFKEAVNAEIPEVNAMHLATVNTQGRPSSRIVLLKGIENGKFVFYTNYQSRKGKELDQNPVCCLTFFWPELERQVRIEGIAKRVDELRSNIYFQRRPRGSQIGAWSSPQSTIIESREILEQRVAQIEDRFKNQDALPRPHQWGGFEIEPFEIEFWQGRPNRLHDRILYTKIDNQWKINRLSP